jgi:hypothetical protein
MNMKIQIIFLAIVLIVSLPTFAQKGKWKPLFDGKTLKGWHKIPGGNWEIKDAMIVGTQDKSDKRHGLLVTDQRFKDFELKVRYKAITGNSGVYFRVDEVGGEVGVHGFQAEIDPTKDAGGLYETGGRAWVLQPKPEDVNKWYKPNKWNTMTIKAIGGNIKVTVNGYTTAELTNDQGRSEGNIALQLHGGMEMNVMFKQLKIKEL